MGKGKGRPNQICSIPTWEWKEEKAYKYAKRSFSLSFPSFSNSDKVGVRTCHFILFYGIYTPSFPGALLSTKPITINTHAYACP
jgi:hypothetical protein